ncbi:c-type cytochrome [Paenibacillus montanisoli]|uniref:Cytochrome c n=1 Tax=Paenibacillus montanisoli TaxID=2081970 RepID=A0A328U0N0_9BACL|nr:cytochrome c [Paenibacillus montanisoli]RAP73534.1 cytochrome c [Paenibacillus montanisoli]
MVKSKWLIAVAGLTLALSLSACGGNNTNTNTDGGTTTNTPDNSAGSNTNAGGGTVDAAAAEEVYKSNCVTCHAADLSGGAGPNLQKVGSALKKDQISQRIHDGGGGMPAFGGQLSDAEIANLASWLEAKK